MEFFRPIPTAAWVIAALVALLHMAPFWRAQSQVPPGWIFTGNLNKLHDFMQYRSWMRQAQLDGPIIADKFTNEPNRPHLLVVFYYAVGKIAHWTQTPPEFVYAYTGSLFAFGLTILLFVTVRYFLISQYQTWWVFSVILIGGGLGTYLKLLAHLNIVEHNPILKRLIIEPLGFVPLFEEYRDKYVFITLFDTHFSLVWMVTTVAILSLYFTLRKYSPARAAITSLLYMAITLLHIYEGVLLIVISAAIGCLCWHKRLLDRQALFTLTSCTLSVLACYIWLVYLFYSSGIPLPTWRAPNTLFSFLILAYPLAWVCIGSDLLDYWRKAGLNECFLLGWALGCTVLTLSGPFYPYSPRGTMTLQIPTYLIAGSIYFSRRGRIVPCHAWIAILLLGAMPIWFTAKQWIESSFNPKAPYMFISTEHRAFIDLLLELATSKDVLLADNDDILWLVPEYRGITYCAHIVWTVDFWRKQDNVIQFFQNAPQRQADFLRQENVRFLYVDAQKYNRDFQHIPGLTLIKATSIGSLFEYDPSLAKIE